MPRGHTWINQIGLRNPGVESLGKLKSQPHAIVSIYGENLEQWIGCICFVPEWALGVELNFSCPNIAKGKLDVAQVVKCAIEQFGEHAVIVKIPPVGWEDMLHTSVEAGATFVHACNTIPTPYGGISGKALKPFSLQVIKQIRKTYPDHIRIIGGGGIETVDDVKDYVSAGVDQVTIGSACFVPWRWGKLKRMAEERYDWRSIPWRTPNTTPDEVAVVEDGFGAEKETVSGNAG